MSNTYKITKKIHELLPKVKAKYGLEFEIENDKIIYYAPSLKTKDYKIGDISMLGEAPSWFLEKSFLLIQEPQLRQILVGLQEVLGENPEYTHWTKLGSEDLECSEIIALTLQLLYKKSKPPQTLSEAFCKKWIDGLDPLFDREPEKVLQELIQILENLLK